MLNTETAAREVMSKVPAVTLGFWAIKILATTLGETGGDTVTMTMNWGYLAGSMLFVGLLVGMIALQIVPAAPMNGTAWNVGRPSSSERRTRLSNT